MNQILVTEKIYVTPELKRKKKIYKILFMLSIFLIISLFSLYIYAEYDRNKEEEISEQVLWLKQFKNIVIKFGRFVPNQTPHYDEILGVNLASDNQYAKKVS